MEPPSVLKMELQGKVAVVTGGGSGLGRHLVEGLGAAGCRVLVADIEAAAAEETAAMVPGAEAHLVDVRDDAALAALVARAGDLGGPHVVVNNAGGWSPGPQFPEAAPEVWSATLDLDLRDPMLLTQLALPAMVAAGGGVVVGIGSSGGVGFAGYGSPEYAAAKAGLVRFTSSLAGLEETHGVRVTAVVPDWIGLDRAVAEVASMEESERPALVPPADVVDAVLDLARTGRGGAVVELWGGRPAEVRTDPGWSRRTIDALSAAAAAGLPRAPPPHLPNPSGPGRARCPPRPQEAPARVARSPPSRPPRRPRGPARSSPAPPRSPAPRGSPRARPGWR